MKRTLAKSIKPKPKKSSPTVNRVEFTLFRKKGELTHASITKRSGPKNPFQKVWTRTLFHSTMGRLEEKMVFNQMEQGKPVSGEVEFSSKKHGSLSGVDFERVEPFKSTFLLSDFITTPWAQRQGLGTQVLAEVIDLLKKKGAKRIVLNVDMGGKNAQSLIEKYEKFGFREYLYSPARKGANEKQLMLAL